MEDAMRSVNVNTADANYGEDTIYFEPDSQFGFEKSYNEHEFFLWMKSNWSLSIWCSMFYVFAIFGCKKYMEKRPRFEIRTPLVLWSLTLAIFSIMGTIRTIPELLFTIENRGIEFSMCRSTYFKGPAAFWAFMFTVSKVYELGDTAFIVLRKQKLIFLHWYHHITVMMYVWYSYLDHTAPARWFMVMNYFVHSVMYSYYTLRALRIRVPKFISMIVTTLQIVQMIWGLVICFWTHAIASRGDFCQQTSFNRLLCFLMYLSYFVLFGNFFCNTYLNKKSGGVISDKDINSNVGLNNNGTTRVHEHHE